MNNVNSGGSLSARKDFKIVPGIPFTIHAIQFKKDKYGVQSPCLMISPVRILRNFTFLEEMVEQVLEEAKDTRILEQAPNDEIETFSREMGYTRYYSMRVYIKQCLIAKRKMSSSKRAYLTTEAIILEVLPYIDGNGILNYKTIKKVKI